MSGGRIPQLRQAAVIVAALIVPLAGAHAVAHAEGPGGSVDGSVTVAALVVTAVTPPATPPAAGDLVTVRVQVRNDLPRPVSALAVGITGAVTAGATVPTLAAGQTADVALPVWFCTAGPTIITAAATGLDGGGPVSAAPSQSTVPVGAGPGCPSDPSIDRFPIRVSAAADRSNPIPLDGRIVGGIIHVFVDPANPALAATRINRVEFRLDGRALVTENSAPFDLARSRGSSARGLDSTLLTNGTHTVTAVVRLRNGTIHRSTATFIVDNGPLVKSIRYSSTPDRSTPQPLDGASLTGRQTYIFVSPTTRVADASVYMFRNGRLIRVETVAPYDLGGTARNGDARPFSLTGLRRGTHTITIEYRLPGGVTITQRASFTRP
jgi:hypothetical protein